MTVSDFLLLNVGGDGIGIPSGGTTAADPQLQFFENFPGHLGAQGLAYSNGTMSFHGVNIPLSVSFNIPAVLMSFSDDAASSFQGVVQLGLFSMNAGTLSLANSASRAMTVVNATSWMSLATSATQNISPGAWYFGINLFTNGVAPHTSASIWGNSSVAPGNAVPGGFMFGRMTASTNAMPVSVATSDLDITGADAIRQRYIIITA